MDSFLRPRSAYCLLPGVWFGDKYPPYHPPQDRLEDVVAAGEVVGIGTITIWRQGIVWFDFSGGPLESPGTDDNPSEAGGALLSFLSQRARLMTAHSTCVMKAFLERANEIHSTGTVVTSSKQIIAGGGDLSSSTPNATDPALRAWCIRRWRHHEIIALWENHPRAETTRQILSEQDAVRSIDLLNSLVQRPEVIPALDLIVRASESLSDHDIELSVIQAWTMIELAIDRLWANMLLERFPESKQDRERLSDVRTYSAAVRTEMLHLYGKIEVEVYQQLHNVRQARNKLLHRGSRTGITTASSALRLCQAMLYLAHGYKTPVAINLGMNL